jgi:hypothetical protein
MALAALAAHQSINARSKIASDFEVECVQRSIMPRFDYLGPIAGPRPSLLYGKARERSQHRQVGSLSGRESVTIKPDPAKMAVYLARGPGEMRRTKPPRGPQCGGIRANEAIATSAGRRIGANEAIATSARCRIGANEANGCYCIERLMLGWSLIRHEARPDQCGGGRSHLGQQAPAGPSSPRRGRPRMEISGRTNPDRVIAPSDGCPEAEERDRRDPRPFPSMVQWTSRAWPGRVEGHDRRREARIHRGGSA